MAFLNISEPHYFKLDEVLNKKIEKRCYTLEQEGHLPKSRDQEKIVLKSDIKKAVDEYWEISELLSAKGTKEEDVIRVDQLENDKNVLNHEMINLTEN